MEHSVDISLTRPPLFSATLTSCFGSVAARCNRHGYLVACLMSAHFGVGLILEGPFKRLAEESLLILGWVANWRPLEIFLYDWWPLTRRRDLYRRLSKAIVEPRPYPNFGNDGCPMTAVVLGSELINFLF